MQRIDLDGIQYNIHLMKEKQLILQQTINRDKQNRNAVANQLALLDQKLKQLDYEDQQILAKKQQLQKVVVESQQQQQHIKNTYEQMLHRLEQ